nr:putative porin [uncultured Roseateles sp.]
MLSTFERRPRASLLSTAIAAGLLGAGSAHADERTELAKQLTALAAKLVAEPAAAPPSNERAELEQLRATTTALIQALVDQGLLNRERAEAMLRQATLKPVAVAQAQAATADPASAWGKPLAATAAAGVATTAPNGVVRVPYIPETLKAQIREDIKLDVLATARAENWADARKFPDWLRGISIDGDVRVRAQGDIFDRGNLPAETYRNQVSSPAWAPDLTNTDHSRQRLSLRARLGINAKVSEDVSGGLRLSTSNRATSATQTLGSGFDRYSFALDRAWLRWEPRHDLRIEGGRMANPFYGTDLIWPDDLSLDGVALRAERNLASGLYAFATFGAFPLQEFELSKADKWLYGAQVGADWAVMDKTQLRVGVAVYDFQNVQGVRETGPAPTGPRAGTVAYQSSQYPAGLRLKGNTLINLNDPTNTGAPVWGLASKFRPINVTAGLTLSHFDPLQLNVMMDYVHNSGFDLADIRKRAGTSAVDMLSDKVNGYQARVQLGSRRLAEKGDWNAFAAYRLFERDAWIDGLTDTTWHGGGTNYKGWSIGGSYFLDRNTSIGLRWTSTRNLDDGYRFLAVPSDPRSISGNLSSAPLKVEVIQIDVNAKF